MVIIEKYYCIANENNFMWSEKEFSEKNVHCKKISAF